MKTAFLQGLMNVRSSERSMGLLRFPDALAMLGLATRILKLLIADGTYPSMSRVRLEVAMATLTSSILP